ncbi:hypothetical protein GOV09_02895 [Candidatus Woesearchaeota archaeon]|nr:hypothetical protein [Candidatus Woesearchaeota archaeon]
MYRLWTTSTQGILPRVHAPPPRIPSDDRCRLVNYLYHEAKARMMKISAVGEVAALLAILDFIYWVSSNTPKIFMWLWIIFGLIVIIDFMNGGLIDKGICKKCFKK